MMPSNDPQQQQQQPQQQQQQQQQTQQQQSSLPPAQLHQPSTHPTSHQHAQSAGFPMTYPGYGPPYQQRYGHPQQQYSANIQYAQTPINYSYTPQYQSWAPPTGFTQPPVVATPSPEISSTLHAKNPLVKKPVKKAILKDPNGKEIPLEDEKDGASSTKSSATEKPTTQTPKTVTKIDPTTSANTSKAVTNSSSNDRTNTSSPPSVSNILLRKVSEDTESELRQAAATTITTTTTPTKATISPPITKPTTTTTTPTKPTPVLTTTAIKPVEVESKVTNINGHHKSTDQDRKPDTVKKDLEVVRENSVEGDTPVDESTVGSNDSTTEPKAVAGEELVEANDKAEAEEKVELEYEPGQYNPWKNRTGKKKYSKQFMVDVCEKICKLSLIDEDKQEEFVGYIPAQLSQIDMFAPSFSTQNQANNRQNDASRRPNNQNYPTMRAGPEKPVRKIITPVTLTPEVELKTVSNPWRPASKEVKEEAAPDVVEVEKLKKQFRSILNKLTPNNFESLSESVTNLHIDTETKLGEVIDIVFAKALAEPGYCVLYGQMCSHLKKITAGTTNFGNTLLKRCQNQFQSDIYSGIDLEARKQKIEDESDPDVKKHMNDELYEEMYRCRMRGLGLIKFIGELYKIEMLNDAIMFDCMIRLLNDTSEESLECLCDLLVTIGEKLDRSTQKTIKEEKKAQKNQPKQNVYQSGRSMASVVGASNAQQQQNAVPEAIATLDDIFDRLHKIRKIKDSPLSMRIKFKLLDVCELREKMNWQSKNTKDNNPKKIEEIRTAHQEKLDNDLKRQAMAGTRRDGRRHLGHSGSSSQISSLGNESGGRGGANMHGSASSHAIRDQELDDKMRQNHSDSYDNRNYQLFSKEALNRFKSALNSSSSDQGRLAPPTLGRPSSGLNLRPNSSLVPSRTSGADSSDSNTK